MHAVDCLVKSVPATCTSQVMLSGDLCFNISLRVHVTCMHYKRGGENNLGKATMYIM